MCRPHWRPCSAPRSSIEARGLTAAGSAGGGGTAAGAGAGAGVGAGAGTSRGCACAYTCGRRSAHAAAGAPAPTHRQPGAGCDRNAVCGRGGRARGRHQRVLQRAGGGQAYRARGDAQSFDLERILALHPTWWWCGPAAPPRPSWTLGGGGCTSIVIAWRGWMIFRRSLTALAVWQEQKHGAGGRSTGPRAHHSAAGPLSAAQRQVLIQMWDSRSIPSAAPKS